MRYLPRILTSLALSIFLLAVALPTAAYAFDPFAAVCNVGGSGSTVCNEKANNSTNPLVGPTGLILIIAYTVATVAGIAAVIILMVSGFRYITSGGDPAKAESAKHGIFNALIGIAVILLATSIISFVLGKL